MVLKLGLCQLLLQFINADPRKQTHFDNFHAFYFIIKVNVDFLCFSFGACCADSVRRSHDVKAFINYFNYYYTHKCKVIYYFYSDKTTLYRARGFSTAFIVFITLIKFFQNYPEFMKI